MASFGTVFVLNGLFWNRNKSKFEQNRLPFFFFPETNGLDSYRIAVAVVRPFRGRTAAEGVEVVSGRAGDDRAR